MLTREQLIHRRIIHVVVIITTAFFIYQFSNWSDALWIPISTLAIIGPFSPSSSINKAKQRMLGTIAGLLLSVLFWAFLQLFPNLLVVIAVLLVYCVGFCLLQEYRFFVLFVSIMLCINFDYMNLFFNNEIVFLANRIMCVFTGVAICQFYEYFVFRHSYDNAIAIIEKERLDQLIISRWECINKYSTSNDAIQASEVDQCINPIIVEIDRLEELKDAYQHNYSSQEEALIIVENYLAKLNSIYYWLSSQAYSVISRTRPDIITSVKSSSVKHIGELAD